MPILGIMASQISGHLWSPEGAYDALATVTVPSGGAASISFAGIPTGYKHLQVRLLARSTRVSAGDYMFMRFNGDSSSIYAKHDLNGDGSGAGSNSQTSQGQIELNRIAAANATTGVFGAGVIDLLDYSNVSKNKTSRAIVSYDNNGSGEVHFQSGLWASTTAISSIAFTCNNNFAEYSSFALYGVK
jgi:hypothetical protein